jgi:1,4-dihydroxy-6-naphthoate synthase
MNIAFSPCPNDTFIFHAWVHGLIPGAPKLDVTYADIDITNGLAASGNGPDILKISFAALPWVLDDYALLPCGGAMGRGCGPLVLYRPADLSSNRLKAPESADPTSDRLTDGLSLIRPINATSPQPTPAPELPPSPAMLAGRRVAVPSERSTAYLLFRLWAERHVPGGVGEIVVMPFHKIMPAVQSGEIDAGLVIHEARFTYPTYGLKQLVDLGSWWEADTGAPIPLGAIIARRSLDLDAISHWIRASLDYAYSHPAESRPYILQHAQEMDPQVAQAHIDLYVNEFSANLGETGYTAVETLLTRAAKAGLIPSVPSDILRRP